MPVAEGGGELPYAGTPEMDALLQNINQNPEMLQVVGQNPALLAEMMKHVGLNTNEQQLIDMVADWPDEAAQASLTEGQGGTTPPAADEADEDEEDTQPPDTSVPVEDADAEVQEANVPNSGSSPMPRSSGGNPIDDLISAQMMQSAVGNPNAPVPQGMQAGRQQRPAIPANKQPKPGNERQAMIADIFRKKAGAGGKKKANA
jgi:hypothetical protein